MTAVERINSDLDSVIQMLEKLGPGYGTKNPSMVTFLLDKIQQEKDREFNRVLNNIV